MRMPANIASMFSLNRLIAVSKSKRLCAGHTKYLCQNARNFSNGRSSNSPFATAWDDFSNSQKIGQLLMKMPNPRKTRFGQKSFLEPEAERQKSKCGAKTDP
jgi:hypothetical protein